ncbi:hypothetical protein [Streptomyces virginiae]|uniref:hypothetical protein n=1 Tax=Streptomyces virginiae TaxID=1961 RepID=UPI0022584E49|nr:hypothetical protein [Streptomyces virginiae]MCX4960169.1 hypothetical protein [Streptomyces virginiae]
MLRLRLRLRLRVRVRVRGPASAVHCRYIGEWVATKHRWGLAVDRAERETLLGYAVGCPDANLAFERAGR